MTIYIAKKSLFDLIRNDDYFFTNHAYLDEQGYLDDIVRSISQLLNTRCILPTSHQQTFLPLNYGLPYLFGLQETDDMMNPNTHADWQKTLERTIQHFEPRLIRPKVKIQKVEIQQQRLHILISATVNIQTLQKKIAFPITLHPSY